MLLNKRDHGVLKAYIRRESEAYRWRNGIRGAEAKAFRDRVFNEIINYNPNKDIKLDYVIVQSLTNTGCTDSELWLSAQPWGMDANLLVIMGTTPRDSLNFTLVERVGKGLAGWNPRTNRMER